MGDYSAAICLATSLLEGHISDGEWEVPKLTFEKFMEISVLLALIGTNDKKRKLSWHNAEFLEEVLETSNVSLGAYKACISACRIAILDGDKIPKSMREFAAGNLGLALPKAKRGRPAEPDMVSQTLILGAIFSIRDMYELTLTRNEASAAHSVCDAVAEALSSLGIDKNYAQLANLVTHPDYSARRLQAKFMYAHMMGDEYSRLFIK